MLKLDPKSAQGLHKLSDDIKTLASYYAKKRQQPPNPQPQDRQPPTLNEQPVYRARFGMLDFAKICIYSIFIIATVKTVILILGW